LTLDEVVAHLDSRTRAGSDFSIIVIAEGAQMEGLSPADDESANRDAFGHAQLSARGVGETLTRLIEERTGHETRTTVLGHLVRGGSPSAYDRIWATRVGAAAYDFIEERRFGWMPVVRCGAVEPARIADVVAEQRRVPQELYELATVFY
jgi:6-phosphofructokinase 1